MNTRRRNKDTLVIVPAHNEEKDVGEVVSRIIHTIGLPVVVVDDGSQDETAIRAERSGALVLKMPFQCGVWGATQAGMRFAVREGYSTVVTCDADGQHPPEAISELLSTLEREKADLVIGSCLERGSPARKVAWRFFRRLTGLGVRDLTSGFRAYSENALKVLIKGKASLIDYQDLGVLLLLREYGLSVTEVPVSMCQRRNGKSKIFYNWLVVIEYLVISFMLSLSKMTTGHTKEHAK